MKSEIVQTAFYGTLIMLATALQDVMPSFTGVKPPLLVCVVLYVCFTLSWPRALIWSLLAGAFADALGALPPICLVGAFVLITASLQRLRKREVFPWCLAGAYAAGIMELWLAIWGVSGNEPLTARMTVAALSGAVLMPLLQRLLVFWEKHAGIDAFGRPTLTGRST